MKEIALSLIKAAATIFPPLASLISKALDNASDEDRALADEVKAILPTESETRKALNDLKNGG